MSPGSILLLSTSDFIFFAFVLSRCFVFLSVLIFNLISSPGLGHVASRKGVWEERAVLCEEFNLLDRWDARSDGFPTLPTATNPTIREYFYVQIVPTSPWNSIVSPGSILLLSTSDFILFAFVLSRCFVFLSVLIFNLISSPGLGHVASRKGVWEERAVLCEEFNLLDRWDARSDEGFQRCRQQQIQPFGSIGVLFNKSCDVSIVPGRLSVRKFIVVLFSLFVEKMWVLCVDPGENRL